MSVKKIATPENDNLKYILNTREDIDAMEDDKDVVVKDVELLLLSALQVYAFDKDRDFWEQSLQMISLFAATFPPERIRPVLGSTSLRIDALLAFTDVWQSPCWKNSISDKILSGEESTLFCSLLENSIWRGQEHHSVPYIAFLLAGTDFPFTEDELHDIRSDAGTSVADVRESVRGKEVGKQ